MKVAIVTGVSSEIGSSIALKMLENGIKVIGTTTKKVNQSTIENGIILNQLDIRNQKSCDQFEKFLKANNLSPSILVNVSGATIVGKSINFSPEDFQNIININLIGQFRLIKTLYPYLKKNKGKIINITSLNGLISFPNFSLYSASKFAFEALGIGLRYEFEKDGVSVTNIAPGAIKSSNQSLSKMPHRPAREKFIILKWLLPLTTARSVSEKVLNIIKIENPPAQVFVGRDINLLVLIKKVLPDFIWDRLMIYIWKK